MSRLVSVEESALTRLKELSTNKGYVIGLIFGQSTVKKDLITFFAPTSSASSSINDNEELNLKDEINVASPVDDLNNFNDKWISSHCNNVSHMLPGGIKVLGVFIVTNDGDASESVVVNKLRALAAYAFNRSKTNKYLNNSPVRDLLLLYYSLKKNKCTCNSFDPSSLNSTLQNVDFKLTGQCSSWIELHSSLDLSNFGPQMVPDASTKNLEALFRNVLEAIKEKLESCKWCFDGKFPQMSDTLESLRHSESDGKGDSNNSSNRITVNIYGLPASGTSNTISIQNCNSEIPINFQGSVVSRVFLNCKTSIEEAVSSIHDDILRTCYKKFEMQWETSDDLTKSPKSKQVYDFPRRVLCSLPSYGFKFSEYLFPDETLEDAFVSFQQQLGFPMKLEFILGDLETISNSEKPNSSSKNDSSLRKEKTVTNTYIIYGILLSLCVLVISILIQLLK